MVMCCVFFEVRAELLNIILTSFGFDVFILKVKQSRYTPWRRLGGEDV
jgi:hypothetical protein